MAKNNRASLKTYAHSLVLAQSSRRLATAKPGFHIDAIVKDGAKHFVLSCGTEVSTAEVPKGGSMRDVCDQLVSILSSKSGCGADSMEMCDPARGNRTELVLTPVKAAKQAK